MASKSRVERQLTAEEGSQRENSGGMDRAAASYEDGRKASDRLYDAVCMRAVNQSIGRSVRHAQDFAAIVLIDNRFSNPRIIGKISSVFLRFGIHS